MSSPNLPPVPSVDEQLDLLRCNGEQFNPTERRACHLELPGIYMADSGGSEPALYDGRIVPDIPTIIAPSAEVRQALSAIRPNRTTMSDARPFLHNLLESEGIIIGFSGYGTENRPYEEEAMVIDGILEHYKTSGTPVRGVIFGGTGYGVPGLSGVLARKHGFPTIGYVPLRSLRGAAPVDTLIVTGEEFGDEAEVLGSTPDRLHVLGGGPIAIEEATAAMKRGSQVVLAAIKDDYPDNSAVNMLNWSGDAMQAKHQHRLVVCKTLGAIKAAIDAVAQDDLRSNRAARLSYLNAKLRSPDATGSSSAVHGETAVGSSGQVTGDHLAALISRIARAFGNPTQ